MSYLEQKGESNYGTIIDEAVFAVGYNDDYLIAKQYGDYSYPYDKGKVNYFILDSQGKSLWLSGNNNLSCSNLID